MPSAEDQKIMPSVPWLPVFSFAAAIHWFDEQYLPSGLPISVRHNHAVVARVCIAAVAQKRVYRRGAVT